MLADIPQLNVYPRDQIAEYIEAVSSGRNAGVQLLIDAANKKGATHTWINNSTAIVEHKGKRILAYRYFGAESALAAVLYGDKAFTKEVWEKAGVATPKGGLVSSAAEAIAFQREIRAPIVVKPRFSFASKGVSVELSTEQEIRDAYTLAKRYNRDVLAEEFLEIQTEYRCFVGAGEVYALVERLPPHVIGDGTSTIGKLIEDRNHVRETIPSTRNEPIEIEGRVESYLAARGKSVETVLPSGEIQQLSHMRILGEGGDLYGVLDKASDGLKELAVTAAEVIPGAHWAGLDLIETAEGKIYAIEINSNSQTNGIEYPSYGQPIPIAKILLEERFKQAEKPRLRNRVLRQAKIKTPPPSGSAQQPPIESDGPDNILLHRLFYRYLVAQGYELEWIGRAVVKAHKGRKVHWFAGCLSIGDLAVVQNVMRKHALVRRALNAANVPRTNGKVMKTGEKLKEYLAEQNRPIAVTPHSGKWKGAEVSVCLTPEEAPIRENQATKYGYYVQPVRPGTRLRILAGPDKCFAVLQTDTNTLEQIDESVALASQAVRAIPGLRWAAVDVVLPKTSSGETRPWVEGLSTDPVVSRVHRLVCGELDEFYEFLLSAVDSQ